jgi:hypothetical protein
VKIDFGFCFVFRINPIRKYRNQKPKLETETKTDKMELVLEPDVYSPSVAENGNYVDKYRPFT